MPRFYGDQSKGTFIAESGLYANTSGTGKWIGLVTSSDFSDSVGVISTRYIGTASRNVGRFDDGPQDFTGVITCHPQDFRLAGYAMGSIIDAGSPSPYTHVLAEVNNGSGNAYTSGTLTPFLSFTWEDSKSAVGAGTNFIKTYKGCVVDTWTLRGTQGALLEAEANVIAQSVTYSSGTTTALTEDTTHVPYKWSHVTFQLPSGTTFPELKSFDFTIANNPDAPHYLNGSRVIATPQMTNRDYTFNTTMDLESARGKTLYDQYFLGGSTFNAMLSIVASAGSQQGFIIMSGCKLTSMTTPTSMSDVQESTMVITPQTVVINVDDLTQLYNPW